MGDVTAGPGPENGDDLLICRRCNVRYAWAADYLDALAEVDRLRARLVVAERAIECGWKWPTYKAALDG